MALEGLNRVIRNTENIYQRRRAALYALSLQYAAKSLNYFRKQQAQNSYWTNQTNQAMDRVFADAFRQDNEIGWFLAHGVEYGVYLELANDGKYQALRPIVQIFSHQYFNDVKKLYGDT